MTHKRLITGAVVVAVVIVLSVAAVIAVLIEDIVDPPDAGVGMKRRCSDRHVLAA